MQPAGSPVVEISELSFGWRSDTPVLAIPQWRVEAAERVFIEGPSGSGKTTLLGLLAGVSKANAGSVRVLGQPLERLSGARRDRFRADHVGYLFQQFNLVPYLDVLDNVLLPSRFSRRRKQRATAQNPAGLAEEASRLLDSLDLDAASFRRVPVSKLSVGQQQRVACARALLGQPELVIADEPTSALDVDSRERFVRLLFEEAERSQMSIVFVSHDPALKPMFDKAVKLEELNQAGH